MEQHVFSVTEVNQYIKSIIDGVSQRGDLYQFSDRSKCHSYALEALSWANATGLIQGKGKDILDPRGLASRAQVAAILQRFHQTYAKPAQTPESGETAT